VLKMTLDELTHRLREARRRRPCPLTIDEALRAAEVGCLWSVDTKARGTNCLVVCVSEEDALSEVALHEEPELATVHPGGPAEWAKRQLWRARQVGAVAYVWVRYEETGQAGRCDPGSIAVDPGVAAMLAVDLEYTSTGIVQKRATEISRAPTGSVYEPAEVGEQPDQRMTESSRPLGEFLAGTTVYIWDDAAGTRPDSPGAWRKATVIPSLDEERSEQ